MPRTIFELLRSDGCIIVNKNLAHNCVCQEKSDPRARKKVIRNARKIVIHYRENAGKKLIHNTAIQTSRFKGFDPLIFEIKKSFAGAVAVDMWATRSVVQAGVELGGNPAPGGLSINSRPRYIHSPEHCR